MATHLLDLLSNAVSPEIIQGLSRSVGEKDESVRQGVSALLPVLLGGMAHKASTPVGAGNVLSMLSSSKVDTGLLGTMGNLLGAGQTSSLMQLGTSLLSGLFGNDKVAGLGSAMATVSGMRASSASSLASLLAPLAFSALKKLVGERKLDAGGLTSLLAQQRDNLSGKLDPRLTAALGLGAPASLLAGLGASLGSGVASAASTAGAAAAVAGAAATTVAGSVANGAAVVANHAEATAVAAQAALGAAGVGAATNVSTGSAGAGASTGASTGAGSSAAAVSGGIGSWLPWIIGAAIIGFVATQFKFGPDKPAPVAVAPAPAPVAPPAATPAPPVVAAAPAPAPIPAAAPSITWPAKVYFDTGKATTAAAGDATVQAVAASLSADSAKKISITGYTDKAGNSEANTKLAKDRAVGVRDALKAAGVAEDRIAMKPPIFVEAGKDGQDPEARRVDIILE